MKDSQAFEQLHGLYCNTHIYGLVTEVLDVLWAHVDGSLTGHDEC